MTRVLLWVAVLVLLEACSASGPRRSTLSDSELLSGRVLAAAGLESAPAPISPADAVALDDEMRAFVAEFARIRDSSVKLRRLLAAMTERGLFSMEYSTAATRSARAAFHERQANCLSFTMLFVSLARAAGLHARYQVVDVPPTWTYDSGLVVIGTHVNTLVDTSGGPTVVDFNVSDFEGRYPTRKVADDYAMALFYSNLGAEALLRDEYAASLAYLREAVRSRADVPAPWVNLGVLYARNGHYEHAEAAYMRALEIEPGERSALVNLVRVYAATGREELAAEYRERARHYQQINPYFHFAQARAAYAEERYEDSLASLTRAIRLKRDERQFYALQGDVLRALGREQNAERSYELASLYSRPPTRGVREEGSLERRTGRLE